MDTHLFGSTKLVGAQCLSRDIPDILNPGSEKRPRGELSVYGNGEREAVQVAKGFNRFDQSAGAVQCEEHRIPVRIPQDYLGAYMRDADALFGRAPGSPT
jgi:hypothetical protein